MKEATMHKLMKVFPLIKAELERLAETRKNPSKRMMKYDHADFSVITNNGMEGIKHAK